MELSMIDHIQTLQSELGGIVGSEYVQPATSADMVDGVQPQLVVSPGSGDEVARVLRLANAAGLAIAPRGGGTKLGWGNRPERLDLVVSTRRLNEVLEHAWGDMTATVQAGCTVSAFQHQLAQHGQHLVLDPLWLDAATIGGILATNDSGALRVRFGTLRDLILGITVALPDGTLAKSGGKVVKNVAGYDLPKLMTGALGTLGIIVDATFRLYPLPAETTILRVAPASIQSANDLMVRVLDSTLVPTGLQCHVAVNQAPEVWIRFEGMRAALEAQLEQLRQICEATSISQTLTTHDLWPGLRRMWQRSQATLICKTSVLPSDIAAMVKAVERVARPLRLDWELVAQAVGVGSLRLHGANDQALLAALTIIRAEITTLGGTVVVLDAPLGVKQQIDVWGPTKAPALMRRVKDHFDPQHMLNPGRFVGF